MRMEDHRITKDHPLMQQLKGWGGWKRSWRQSKGKAREVKLAQSMESVPDLDTTTAILECRELWDDFHAICKALKEGGGNSSQAAIAAVTMYESVQRPSAVMGLTVTEYSRAAFVDGVWVILVEEHKTGKQGPARLMLSEQGKRKLDKYVEHVCDLLGDHLKLLSLPSGCPVTDVNKLLS